MGLMNMIAFRERRTFYGKQKWDCRSDGKYKWTNVRTSFPPTGIQHSQKKYMQRPSVANKYVAFAFVKIPVFIFESARFFRCL